MKQTDDQLIEKFWQVIGKRQQSINKQMDASEKKIFQKIKESRRVLEEMEKNFFNELDEKKQRLSKTENEFYRKMEAKGIYFESNSEKEEHKTSKKINKKQIEYKIEISDHPVYSAIIKLLSDRGYKLDEETLRLYWNLVTSMTRV